MNPFEKLIGSGQSEAVLRYGHNDFQVAVQGDYVRCAVTGTRIEVDNLKYWSVEFQEPYVSAQASFRRFLEHRGLTERFQANTTDTANGDALSEALGESSGDDESGDSAQDGDSGQSGQTRPVLY